MSLNGSAKYLQNIQQFYFFLIILFTLD